VPEEMRQQHRSVQEQEEEPRTDPKVEMTPAGDDTHLSVPGWAGNRLETPRAGGASGQGWAGRCPVPACCHECVRAQRAGDRRRHMEMSPLSTEPRR